MDLHVIDPATNRTILRYEVKANDAIKSKNQEKWDKYRTALGEPVHDVRVLTKAGTYTIDGKLPHFHYDWMRRHFGIQ
jgi:hypothetical protein